MQKQEFWRGVKESFPVLLGLIPVALVLGAQAAQNGFLLFQVPLMTGTNFAGGSEFAAVSLWSNPVNIGLVVTMSVLINSRYLIMGAAFSSLIKHLPPKKALPLLFFMVDESWAMSLAEAHKNRRTTLNIPYFWGVVVSLYIMWVLCTTLGAYFGPMIGDLETYGFDMAFAAIFLVLIKGMWKGLVAARPWLVSLVVAGCLYHWVAGAWYVVGGVLAGVLSAYFWSRK